MKLLIILTIVLLLMGIPTFAQNVSISQPGMLPDNPFHPFQDFFEQLQLFFAFSPEAKANIHLQLAEKRLAELNLVIEQNKTDLVPILSDKFEKELNDTENEINSAKTLGQNVTEIAQHVAGETFKHQLVLQNLLDKVPEQARPSIVNAINKSQEGHIAAVESILESGNATGNVNMTFVVGGQTFTQTFVVSSEHGKPKILGGGTVSGQNIITTPSQTTSTTITTTTTSPPVYPIQILSVQTIPENPNIGDTLDFNVTVRNVGNVPVYYGGGAASTLSATYSNTSIFGDPVSACSSNGFLATLNSMQSSSVYLACSNRQLISTGVTVANLTFAWGYDTSQFNNSISFLQTVNIS